MSGAAQWWRRASSTGIGVCPAANESYTLTSIGGIAMNKTILPLLLLPSLSIAQPQSATFPLDSLSGLEALNVKAEATTYRGRSCIRLLDQPGGKQGHAVAILTGTDFEDGTIEAEIAGVPRAGAVEAARGFIGVAFRVQPHADRFECFYVRPTNGRAEDQLRRNHSTQYTSEPDYPWDRLRQDNPGVYESYVDL